MENRFLQRDQEIKGIVATMTRMVESDRSFYVPRADVEVSATLLAEGYALDHDADLLDDESPVWEAAAIVADRENAR